MRIITNNKQHSQRVDLPRVQITEVLQLAHDKFGHNYIARTYYVSKKVMLLEQLEG